MAPFTAPPPSLRARPLAALCALALPALLAAGCEQTSLARYNFDPGARPDTLLADMSEVDFLDMCRSGNDFQADVIGPAGVLQLNCHRTFVTNLLLGPEVCEGLAELCILHEEQPEVQDTCAQSFRRLGTCDATVQEYQACIEAETYRFERFAPTADCDRDRLLEYAASTDECTSFLERCPLF
jgi:hypothetical protein